MAESDLAQRVAAVRRFNRFYTRQIGILDEGYLHSPFSLAEARVLYELAHHGQTTASEIGSQLGLDAGYLSRILRGFEQRGLIEKQPSPTDGRQSLLRITEVGQAEFATINARSHDEIAALLGALPPDDQGRLVAAMDLIEAAAGREARAEGALYPAAAPARRYGLGGAAPWRTLRPGVRLGRADGRAGRQHRRRDYQALRPRIRALLDRRGRWRCRSARSLL